MVTSVLNYLDNAAVKYADKIALVEQEKNITYAEMAMTAKKIATNLIVNAGSDCKPIVVLMDKSMEAVISFWGILYSGNIYVPMDAFAPMERINKIIDFVQPAAVIIDGVFADKASELHVEADLVYRYETLIGANCRGAGKDNRYGPGVYHLHFRFHGYTQRRGNSPSGDY